MKITEATGGVRFACAKINCFGLQFRMILKSILKDNLKNFFTLIMGVDKRGNKLTKRRKDMKVKDLIKYLSKFDKNLDIVFYNELLDNNHWGCELNIDDINGKDLIIVPTIEE